MNCSRCNKEKLQIELKQLAKSLRYLLAPLFILNPRHKKVVEEANSVYCKQCVRVLNLCLFFWVFLIYGLLAIVALSLL